MGPERRLRDVASLDDVADAAASAIGLDTETLVKDYWVTEVLRVLATRFPGSFVFKGGTSLTKALRCVDRFSEDIDVLVVESGSERVREILLRAMRDAVIAELGLEVVHQFSSRGRAREVHLRFRTRAARRYQPMVRLEMGVRGADHPPHELLPVAPLLTDAFDAMGRDRRSFRDLDPFVLAVQHPARTLWEKVVLLHTLVERDEHLDVESTRLGRHYGDVGALLAVPSVGAALADAALRRSIDESVRDVSARWFRRAPEPVPEGGYARSRAFHHDGSTREQLAVRYGAAVDLLWGPTGRLDFDTVIARVQRSHELLSVEGCSRGAD